MLGLGGVYGMSDNHHDFISNNLEVHINKYKKNAHVLVLALVQFQRLSQGGKCS